MPSEKTNTLIQAIIYYSFLYAIVIVNNYFKLRREEKTSTNPSDPEEKFDLTRVFYVSNEIIYTASGVFILLLDKQKDWVSPIAVALLFLVLISTNLDSMPHKFSAKGKLIVHLVIIAVVIAGTVLTFTFGLDKSDEENKKSISLVDSIKTYSVNLRYKDKTLIKHLGYEKFGDKYLNYKTIVTCNCRKNAIKMGIANFWADTTVTPILKCNESKKTIIEIDIDNVSCETKDE